MSIISQFPRRNFIPTANITLTDFDFEQIPVLDLVKADYVEIFETNVIGFTEFIITSSFEGRPDLIAYKFYESTDLWWAICIFNSVINPVFELTVGKILRIPQKEQLEFLLQSTKPSSQNPRTVDIP